MVATAQGDPRYRGTVRARPIELDRQARASYTCDLPGCWRGQPLNLTASPVKFTDPRRIGLSLRLRRAVPIPCVQTGALVGSQGLALSWQVQESKKCSGIGEEGGNAFSSSSCKPDSSMS